MSDIRKAVEDLNRMIVEGKALEAFDRYYDEEVVMQEGAEDPVVGKTANRDREEDFFSKVTDFRAARVKSLTVGEDVSTVEWHFDYTHADWGPVAYDQVAVQRWDNGKIVHERFYRAA